MKRNIVLCLSLALCLLAAGCGGQSAPAADAAELADRLSTQIQFEDTLSPLEGDMLYTLYGIDQKDVQQGAAYVSTGATAEEIAVFSCTDDRAAQRVENAKTARRQPKAIVCGLCAQGDDKAQRRCAHPPGQLGGALHFQR